jgi:hypothetical protein
MSFGLRVLFDALLCRDLQLLDERDGLLRVVGLGAISGAPSPPC